MDYANVIMNFKLSHYVRISHELSELDPRDAVGPMREYNTDSK